MKRLPFWGWLLGGAVAFFLAHAVLQAWTIDDAEITYTYARSLVGGRGFGVSPEAMPVEGFSNPLLFVVSAAVALVGLHPFIFHNILEPLEFGLLLFFVWHLLGGGRRGAVFTAVFGVLQLLTPATLIWYGSGLENLQLTLGVVVLLFCLEQMRRRPRLGRDVAVVVAVALIRPESLLYDLGALAAFAGFSLVRDEPAERRRFLLALAKTVAASAAALAVLALIRWRIFGVVLPNTYYAKVGPGAPVVPGGERYVFEVATYAGSAALAVFGLVMPVAARARALKTALVALVPLALALPAVGGKDWMGEYRFGTTYFALAQLLFVLALAAARWPFRARSPLERLPPRLRFIPAALAVALIVAPLATMRDRVTRFPALRAGVDNAMDTQGFARIDIQRHLGLFSPVVGLADVGGSRLAGKMQLIDTLGLADFHVPRVRPRPPLVYRYELGERGADIIVNHGAATIPRWALGRELVLLAAFPGNPRTFWVRRDLVESSALPPGARLLEQRGALRVFSSPDTIPLAAPGAYARVELILQIDPDSVPAERPGRPALALRLGADEEELAFLGVTPQTDAPLPMTPGLYYRQAFLLRAPEAPGRHAVTLSRGLGAPLPVGWIDVATFTDAQLDAAVGTGSLVERAARLAQLREQLQPRRPRAETARDLTDFRAAGTQHPWSMLAPWHRLLADFTAPAPYPPALRRRADALLEEARAQVATLLDAPDPALPTALLAAGRLVDALRRRDLPGVFTRPEPRSVLEAARRRVATLTEQRYLALVGLTLLDPADVRMQKALLAARPQGADLPYLPYR